MCTAVRPSVRPSIHRGTANKPTSRPHPPAPARPARPHDSQQNGSVSYSLHTSIYYFTIHVLTEVTDLADTHENPPITYGRVQANECRSVNEERWTMNSTHHLIYLTTFVLHFTFALSLSTSTHTHTLTHSRSWNHGHHEKSTHKHTGGVCMQCFQSSWGEHGDSNRWSFHHGAGPRVVQWSLWNGRFVRSSRSGVRRAILHRLVFV